MSDDEQKTARKGDPPRTTVSFLVRCWEEPRASGDEPPLARCLIRNLQTGEERHLNDPGRIGEAVKHALKSLDAFDREGRSEGRSSG